MESAPEKSASKSYTHSPARMAAFDVLFLVDQRRRRRKLKLDKLMDDIRQEYQGRGKWGGEEQALFHALCTGVVRHWWGLESRIMELTERDMRRITPQVRTLLRMGLFQLLCCDGIPDYAAVSEAAALAQRRKFSQKTVGFVNAVLRNAARKRDANALLQPDLHDDAYGYLMRVGGLPNWWARRLLDAHTTDDGRETLAAMCVAQQTPVPLSLRINTLKISTEAADAALKAADVEVATLPGELGELLPEMRRLEGFMGSPTQLPGYTEGYLYAQDVSSARVAGFAGVQPGNTVIDLCAAPGSKTTHMAAKMENTGRIIALDNSEKRLEDLTKIADTLGATCIHSKLGDAKTITLEALELNEGADVVLVDTPCSGLGTVRKHPEILLNLREQDMAGFADTQQAILANAATLVKPGGTLVYSTCSVDKAENQAVVQAFMAKNPSYTLEEELALLTHAEDTVHWDGFYMARLRKQG